MSDQPIQGSHAGSLEQAQRLQALGNWVDARAAYQALVADDPQCVPALLGLALSLAAQGQHEEALPYFKAAIDRESDRADVWCNLAISHQALRQSARAELAYLRSLAISPDAITWSNLGSLMTDLGRTDDAERCFRSALALDPNCASAYDNCGLLYCDLGRWEEAEAHFREAIRLAPSNTQAAFNLSQLVLALGRYDEGWALHEVRFAPGNRAGRPFMPHMPCPQWRGEPLAGKSLLVWLEQGLGDEIQFSRFIAEVKATGARKVSYVCHPALARLFASLDGIDTLVPFGDGTVNLAGHDYWCFTLSLPYGLHTDTPYGKQLFPYLATDAPARQTWQGRLPAGKLRVGLVWRGNPRHHNDSERSISALTALAPLWSVPGIDFISLQRGRGEDEARYALSSQPILALGHELADFADTAAIIEQLDLVITVDTAAAHLAGALGQQCWVLLPQHRPDWRWQTRGETTPWYPTMRLFRQTARSDWASVIDAIRAALLDWALTQQS